MHGGQEKWGGDVEDDERPARPAHEILSDGDGDMRVSASVGRHHDGST